MVVQDIKQRNSIGDPGDKGEGKVTVFWRRHKFSYIMLINLLVFWRHRKFSCIMLINLPFILINYFNEFIINVVPIKSSENLLEIFSKSHSF